MIQPNSIIHGDFLEISRKIDDNSVDLIVTDPPYKITSRGNAGGMLLNKLSLRGNIFEHNDCDVKYWMPQLFRILKSGTHCYIMCNHLNLIEYLNTATQCGFHFIKSIIWDKCQKIMGRAYMSQYEYILMFRKGEFKQVNDCGISDIISIPNKKPRDKNGKNLHDTSKPISLIQILIKQSTNKGDLVLDPFAGIGTTAISCINTERKYICCEIDDRYFKIANDLINFRSSEIKQDLFYGL